MSAHPQISLDQIQLSAPAKLNLFLHVRGRFANGFHAIETLIVPISLADSLNIRFRSDSTGVSFRASLSEKLACHIGKSGAIDEINTRSNLACRAAEMFLECAGLSQSIGLDVELKKHIPWQAGLGGGSADAAAVLRGLNAALKKPLDNSLIVELAEELGSDVPALLSGTAVFASGRGERLHLLRSKALPAGEAVDLSQLRLLVLKPPEGVLTKEAYLGLSRAELSSTEETRLLEPWENDQIVQQLGTFGLCFSGKEARSRNGSNSSLDLTFSLQEGISGPSQNTYGFHLLGRGLHNDFECFVLEHYSQTARAHRVLLDAGVEQVMLAGSGSAVIGFVRGQDAADSLAARVRDSVPNDWFLEVAQVVTAVDER